ncbi:lipoyl(octanoyl) transferase LipB [Thiomicrorhabdus sp. Kp2]|uniref:lipoyl(octanoyl) transferase LipB n=1 Tax=Thiomicrorhabdus sp. Kp2 TaxID=1123518 RepID=UPI00040F2A03|nr:lipoyl(octanoyl) transferase LipB [Thiomicrorhabdus sp. Kp2]
MKILIKPLGLQPYEKTWQAMQAFTDNRNESTPDELWIVEHPSVFTQGLNGKAEHILQNSDIPIVQTDRGGQITYHAPGQVVIYVLIDLKRAKLGVRALVSKLENSIIEYLSTLNIPSLARTDAPGVYVNGQKIASLGLKIRKQKSYHGLALNVNMDLSPFQLINPCGLQGMQMTQLSQLLLAENTPTVEQAGLVIAKILSQQIQASID